MTYYIPSCVEVHTRWQSSGKRQNGALQYRHLPSGHYDGENEHTKQKNTDREQ